MTAPPVLPLRTRISIFLRALFFFPTVLSSVSVAFVWSFVYDPTFGLANRLLTVACRVGPERGVELAR